MKESRDSYRRPTQNISENPIKKKEKKKKNPDRLHAAGSIAHGPYHALPGLGRRAPCCLAWAVHGARCLGSSLFLYLFIYFFLGSSLI